MNTITKSYVTKFSSGTILALLLFSGFLFLVPVAATVYASNASPPAVTVTANSPLIGAAANALTFTLSNPASNQFALTAFTLIAPAGWSVSACGGGTIFTIATPSGNSCQYSGPAGAAINPGSTSTGLGITTTPPAPSGTNTYPYTGTFSSSVQDGSGSAFYGGPSFALQVMSSTSSIAATPLVITPGAGNTATSYKAGTAPYTITATITCTPGSGCPSSGVEAGLPVVWSASGTGAAASSFTPSSGSSAADGTSSTTFQPTNNAAAGSNSETVTAKIGTSTCAACSQTSAAITTVAGAASTVVFLGVYAATHYIGTVAGEIGNPTGIPGNKWATLAAGTLTANIDDAFGNKIDLSTLGTVASPYAVTISAVAASGQFDNGGALPHPTSVTCGAGVTCPTLAGSFTLAVSLPYFQSGNYGSSGLLTAGASGTAPAFAAAGSSGSLITTTFDTAPAVPTVTGAALPATCAAAVPPAASPCAVAGNTVTLTWNTTAANKQAGIPVKFFLHVATSSAGYAGLFSNSLQWITVATGSNGGAQAAFSVDTSAGATAFFNATFTRPTDANPTGATPTSADTPAPPLKTIAAAASKMKVDVYFTNTTTCPTSPGFNLCDKVASSSVGGVTLWVNALFSDAFGNAATNPGPNAVQVTLTASAGVLSATTIYIPQGGSNTYASFGPIAWTIPAPTGASLKLNASGVVSGVLVSGGKSVTTVSANPTIAVTSPTATGGVVYSKSTGVVFNGKANVSAGYPSAPCVTCVTISTVTFSVDGGAAQGATIVSGTVKVTWSAGVFFTAGLHNITFTATDSNSNSVTSAAWKVLVDNSAPTIGFRTKTGSSINYSSSVNAWINDKLGDLNTTSVAAWYNGTAVSSANIVLSGTQTLGANSTTSVAIKNLPAGTWVVLLSASDLAGNANPGVSITVTVVVPFALSVVINSAVKSTIGGYTGVLVSATNVWSSSQSLVIFAVWKNSAGQTVAVATGGLTLASGATGTAFAPLGNPLASGTYSVQVFAITTSNNPVSSATTISVTI